MNFDSKHSKHSYYFVFALLTALIGFEFSWTYLTVFFVINSYYTLGEYLIHRFLFHSLLPHAHQKHHDDPKRFSRLFIPIPVTLMNDLVLGALAYHVCPDIWFKVVSAAHLSYLLFEWAHYSSHYPSYSLPTRLISFHHSHHVDDKYNFGFTTPFWDILFGTTQVEWKLSEYPLSCLPISIVGFIKI